jgi:outer membrane protein OmpA-like peptidoglycan-associated protein
MTPTRSLLLAGTALFALAAAAPMAQTRAAGAGLVLAQAAPQGAESNKKKNEQKPAQKPAPKPAQPPRQAQPQKPAQPPRQAQPQKPAQPPKPAQVQQKPPEKTAPPQRPPQPKAVQQHEAPKAPPPAQRQGEPRREERGRGRAQENRRPQENVTKPAPPPAAATKPEPQTKPATTQQKPPEKPAAVQQPPAQKPAAEQKPAQPSPATTPAKPPANTPAAQTPAPQKPAAQTPAATQPPPASNAQPAAPANRNATVAPPVAVAPPQKPQSAQQYILRKNARPTATIQDLRKERHERREGNRTVITEGNRTIVKQDNRVVIHHNEAQRFAVGARDVKVERHGGETTTVIVRPNGDRIVDVTDEHGRLIRRARRDRGGREVVIIDERRRGPRPTFFVDLPPPVIHIPRDRYIVELDRARPETVYEVLDAPPVEAVEEAYTVDQVRYSTPLRERMPRLDLDINFDSGSWQLTPDQIDKLSVVAEGLNRAIERNPREVFLIEGHTDAVGSPEDNLSLSDRRAESVAVALTEEFQVPPENLVTQGYGEQNLKVQTEEAARANRRVSVRRITPLIDQQAAR